MDMGTFGIAFALLVNVALLLWFVIGAKGYWWIKVPVIAVTLFLSIGIWSSVNDLLGWATSEPMPEKFQVHWIVIDEPNSKEGDPGAIFVWATDLNPQPSDWWIFHSMDDSGEPRAHKMPYSRQLHEQSQAIMQIIKKGGQFKGTMKGPPGKPGKPGEGKKGKPGKKSGSFSKEQVPMFYQLPPPKFPKKNPAQ